MSRISDKYDVVIVGAGIGGLVCGCYLVKNGLKVLIVEKNRNPGGYCASFKRGKYVFDAGIRGLVGGRDEGHLGKVLNELNVKEKLKIVRSPIFDIIHLPDYRIALRNDPLETKNELQSFFPSEAKSIDSFFSLLSDPNFLNLYAKTISRTFKQLLDEYFKDYKLKTFWNILRAETGLLPSDTAALAGLNICRGFLLDGGYYPIGGMQALADAFLSIFKENGGDLLFSKAVKKIQVNRYNVTGVLIDKDIYVKTKCVVSDCDVSQTFLNLIDEQYVRQDFRSILNRMVPSLSVFVVFLGVGKSYKNTIEKCCSLWYFSHYLKEKEYDFINTFDLKSGYVICVFPSFQDPALAPADGESIYLYVGAPFKDEKFWEDNHSAVVNTLIKQAENVIPSLKSNIIVKETASPTTFYKWTLNRSGSSRGWAPTLEQTKSSLVPVKTFINGLFLSSHWSTSPVGHGGIAAVSYTGRKVAKMILAKKQMGGQ